METGGVILCGGKSTRMGVPKATLPFGDETMLARVVRLLSEVVQPIVVVAAQGQQLPSLPDEVLLAHDEADSSGPLEGLRAGLTALEDQVDAAYATSCDVPLMKVGFVREMIARLGDHDIAVPTEGKFHHPLAAVYRPRVVPKIESLLEVDRLRPLFLFDACDTVRVPADDLRAVDPDLSTLENLNHPEDYQAALKRAGFDPPQ